LVCLGRIFLAAHAFPAELHTALCALVHKNHILRDKGHKVDGVDCGLLEVQVQILSSAFYTLQLSAPAWLHCL